MPSSSKKQQRFFGLVRAVQKGEKSSSDVSPEVRKVANSISAKDASDFASSVAEVKLKKAVLEILKDIRQPMYLQEQETNPVAKTFTVKDDFEKYVKRYIGQPLSPKELEAIDNFENAKPTKIERAEIRYENTDEFKNTSTTIVKKMKDSGQFSFNAFTKHKKMEIEPDEKGGEESSMPPGNEPMGGEEPPMFEGTGPGEDSPYPKSGFGKAKKGSDSFWWHHPQTNIDWDAIKKAKERKEKGETDPPNLGDTLNKLKKNKKPPGITEQDEEQKETPMEDPKEDVIVTKSVLFKDEIKGAAILAEFLKKLDL